MPNRLLKDSITHSREIDSLSWFQEVCFYRLMVKVDDFGRYYADPQIVKSDLFPTKENLTKGAVSDALEKLESVGLIERYNVGGLDYLHICKWDLHQQRRATKSKFPLPDDDNGYQLISDDINGNQSISDDNNCPRIRNRIRNSIIDNRSRNTDLIDADNAAEINNDHNRVLDAAEDAGFKMSNDVRASMISLYAEYGLQNVIDAMRSCVEHGATNLAYLKAVLRGEPKKQKPRVAAQDYEQRDYSDEQADAMRRMLEMGSP